MQVAQLLFRITSLTILLAGALLAAIGHHPREADHPEFSAALERGRIERVVLPAAQSRPSTVHTASWSTGPWQWRKGAVTTSATDADEFRRDMAAHGVAVETTFDDEDDDRVFDQPFWAPQWWGNVIGALWLVMFFAMIASRPRYGNRWAWFWLFTVGEIGVFLYLLLEPTPLWRPRFRDSHTDVDPTPITDVIAPDRRWTGGQGCLASILAAIAVPFLSAAIGWAAGHAFG